MAHYQLRNGRRINHSAYHDLFCDDIEILHEKGYIDCYNYVLENGKDTDFYTEPDACPDYKGETVAELKVREVEMKKEWSKP